MHGATPDFLIELHGAVVEQTHAIQQLAAVVAGLERGDRMPFRDSAVTNVVRVVRTGPALLKWLHASNAQGVTDAYLHFFDEYNGDAVILGSTPPRITLWLPAGGGDDGRLSDIEFDRGLSVAVTSTPDGAAAPGTPVLVNISARKRTA